ncbi:Uncharacterised protein [Vibrio cholerae]|nr:Uncharacterised protein [Vibrio cholerae]CSI64738.1 Uncharacterised protein [Vibrio cholerae]
MAIGRDIIDVRAPQLSEPARSGFTSRIRHIITHKRLNCRFVGADTKDVSGDIQFLKQSFVVHGVGAVTF